jgi:hypothetical protein
MHRFGDKVSHFEGYSSVTEKNSITHEYGVPTRQKDMTTYLVGSIQNDHPMILKKFQWIASCAAEDMRFLPEALLMEPKVKGNEDEGQALPMIESVKGDWDNGFHDGWSRLSLQPHRDLANIQSNLRQNQPSPSFFKSTLRYQRPELGLWSRFRRASLLHLG